MNTQFWVVQAFNGVSYGALLFLVGAGLSLIFGVMRIVNLSHGSYFLLGGYVALSVIGTTGSWLLSIPIAAITIAVVGLIMERLFLRPEGRAKLVRDAVIALGIALVIRLRRVLHALDPGAALELLVDKLRATKSNEQFLKDIAKAPAGN